MSFRYDSANPPSRTSWPSSTLTTMTRQQLDHPGLIDSSLSTTPPTRYPFESVERSETGTGWIHQPLVDPTASNTWSEHIISPHLNDDNDSDKYEATPLTSHLNVLAFASSSASQLPLTQSPYHHTPYDQYNSVDSTASPPPTAVNQTNYGSSSDSAYTTLMTPPMPGLALPSPHSFVYHNEAALHYLKPHPQLNWQHSSNYRNINISQNSSALAHDMAAPLFDDRRMVSSPSGLGTSYQWPSLGLVPFQVPEVLPQPRRINTPIVLPATTTFCTQERVNQTTPPLPPTPYGLFSSPVSAPPLCSPPPRDDNWVPPEDRPLPSVSQNHHSKQSVLFQTGTAQEGGDDGDFQYGCTSWQSHLPEYNAKPNEGVTQSHSSGGWTTSEINNSHLPWPTTCWPTYTPTQTTTMSALLPPEVTSPVKPFNTMPFADHPYTATATSSKGYTPSQGYMDLDMPILTTSHLASTSDTSVQYSSDSSYGEMSKVASPVVKQVQRSATSNRRKRSRVRQEATPLRASDVKQRRYKCGTCSDTFARRNDRERHIMCKHTAERPYHCEACGKSWARCDKYREHLQKKAECKKAAPPEHLKNKRAKPTNFRL